MVRKMKQARNLRISINEIFSDSFFKIFVMYLHTSTVYAYMFELK